jgi:hypothetical protein
MRNPKAAWLVLAFVFSASAALAQAGGAVTITANVRSSVLLSVSTPAGIFSQGGDQSASATITLQPASEAQTLSTRAVTANNPNSTGYDLIAKLAGPDSVTLDGIELSRSETVIASQAPYGILQTHSIMVSGPAAVNIVLTCRPR